jgi:hypothetical protein
VEHLISTAPYRTTGHAALAALEEQLIVLDRLGTHIAAAHLDAAIQQLRRDLPGR